jgi:hypothetical protein
MTLHPTASQDAIQHSTDFDANETVRWLQPRSGQPGPNTNVPAWKLFRRITTSVGIGALLTLATAGAAIAPASARTAEPVDTAASALEVALPPDADTLVVAATEPAGGPKIHLPKIETVEAAPIAIPATAAAPSPGEVVADDEQIEAAISSNPVEVAPEVAAGLEPQTTQPQEHYLQFDGMRVPRWIVETILRAAEVTEVDPVYMMALADKESSFLPGNRAATSSAEGLFQFISSTWLEVVRSFGAKHGLAEEAAAIQVVNGQLTVPDEATRDRILVLRRDPYLSALMAGEMMKRDRARIERRLGRRISRSEFYLAHFFGVDSASKFMSLLDDKPKQSAPREFPAAAKANRSLFFAKNGRKTRHLTVAEVYGKIDEMIDKRLMRYGDVTTLATADASL